MKSVMIVTGDTLLTPVTSPPQTQKMHTGTHNAEGAENARSERVIYAAHGSTANEGIIRRKTPWTTFLSSASIVIALSSLCLSGCGSGESEVTAPTRLADTISLEPPSPSQAPAAQQPDGNAHSPRNPAAIAPDRSDRERLTQIFNPAPINPKETATTGEQNRNCGIAPGNRGKSYAVYAFNNTDCATIMVIAQQFGPQLKDKRQHIYQSWLCGPANVPGFKGICSSDSGSFGLKDQE